LLEQVIREASDCVAKPLRGALRGDLDAIVAVTLRKDPGERYATAAALRDDLVGISKASRLVHGVGRRFYRTRKFVARYRWFVFGSVIAALTLCAVSLVAIDQARSAQRQALIASQEAAKATATTKFLEKVFAGPHIGKGSHRPPHELTAAELLDSGSAEMFNSLEQQPEIMLELIRVVGDIFMVMEDVDKSIALYRRGVEFAERRFGPVNSMKAELLVRVADAEAYAGRAAAANADVAIAEAAITAAGDEHSRHYARMLKVKGNLLLMKGSEFAAEAKEPLRRAAALFAEHFPNDVARAFALIYLAQAHLKLNEDVQAEQAAEQAVLATNNSNLDLIDQASAYSLRASIRHRLGKLGLAAGDYEIASTLYRRSVGTDHFMYVQNEGLRGELLQLSGHRSEGLALVEETTAQLASLRKGTPTYAIAARRLAQAYLRDGSYTRAIETNTEAIALVRPLQFGPLRCGCLSHVLCSADRL